MEWDPNQRTKLVRTITIPGSNSAEGWQISFAADPLPLVTNDGNVQQYLVADFGKKFLPLNPRYSSDAIHEILKFPEEFSEFVSTSQCKEAALLTYEEHKGLSPFTKGFNTYIMEFLRCSRDEGRACLEKLPTTSVLVLSEKEQPPRAPNFGSAALEKINKLRLVAQKLWQIQQQKESEPLNDIAVHFRNPWADKESRTATGNINIPRPPLDSGEANREQDTGSGKGPDAGRGRNQTLPARGAERPGRSEVPNQSAGPPREELGVSPLDFSIQIAANDRLLSAADAIDRIATLEGAGGGLRSFGDSASAVATDVVQILAEIAFERAKSKAFSLLSEKITNFVCGELRIPFGVADNLLSPDELKASENLCRAEKTAQLAAQQKTSVTEKNARSQANETLANCYYASEVDKWPQLLPATCQTVQNLRIQELSTSGKTLLNALTSDLALRATALALRPVAPTKSTDLRRTTSIAKLFSGPLSSAVRLIVRQATGQSAISNRDVQLLFIQMSQLFRDLPGEVNSSDQELASFSKAVQISFAILAECSNSVGRCDAQTIAEMLKQPARFFGETPPGDIEARWPGARYFIAHGLDVLLPPKGATPQQLLRAVIDMAFELSEALYSHDVLPATATQESLAFGKLLHELHKLSIGLLDHDSQISLLALVRIVELSTENSAFNETSAGQDGHENLQRVLRRTSQIVASISSYAQSYSVDDHDPKAVQAQREARKKAIESLIDQATQRTNRQGNLIFSLGANVGFHAGYEYRLQAGGASWFYPQLSLPMGVAIEKLPWGSERTNGTSRVRDQLGLHAQLSIIDLAQFLNYSDQGNLAKVEWSNFVTLGAQVGLLFGFTRKARASELFNLVLDVRYAPGLHFTDSLGEETKPGVFRLGLYLGYYVPFFDFN